MKCFITKSLLFFILIVVTVASTNYIGDAAHIFTQNYEKQISDILLSGNNVTNIGNYDERALQRLLVKNSRIADTVVLGSSRMMLYGEQIFGKLNIQNSAVSGATLEDLIGIYQIYKSENKLPKNIIIGVDPWIFNAHNGQERWITLKKEYCFFLKVTCDYNSTTKLEQLISPSYFQSSFWEIWKRNDQPVMALTMLNRRNTKLTDGSLVYGKEMRSKTEDEISASIENYLEGDIYGFRNFNKLSPRYVKEFKKLISDIIKSGVELEFYLVPYPPKVYKLMQEDYPVIIEIENLLISLAKKEKISLRGSYNPSIYNFKNIDFYDGMHLRAENLIRLNN